MIKKRKLGDTDLKVSVIGFGCWGISGDWGKPHNETEILETFATAIDAGINLFDTAAVYGSGYCEELVGKILKQDIIVVTKVPATEKPKSPLATFETYYPPEHVKKTVETSIKRLKKQPIDIVLFHNWHPDWNKNANKYFATLQSLKKEGKINNIGVSLPNWMDNNIDELLENRIVDCVELPLNLFQQWGVRKVSLKAKKFGVGVLARSCLDHGSLGGILNHLEELPTGDFRVNYFAEPRKSLVSNRNQHMIQTLKITKEELPAYAIHFVINQIGVSSALIGMRDKDTVIKNVGYFEHKFSKYKLKKGLEFNWNRGW